MRLDRGMPQRRRRRRRRRGHHGHRDAPPQPSLPAIVAASANWMPSAIRADGGGECLTLARAAPRGHRWRAQTSQRVHCQLPLRSRRERVLEKEPPRPLSGVIERKQPADREHVDRRHQLRDAVSPKRAPGVEWAGLGHRWQDWKALRRFVVRREQREDHARRQCSRSWRPGCSAESARGKCAGQRRVGARIAVRDLSVLLPVHSGSCQNTSAHPSKPKPQKEAPLCGLLR
jgi:hypothetical protein